MAVDDRQVTAQDAAVSRFLRLCLRGRWDPQALEAARTLVAHDELPWNVVQQVARQERVAPLLSQVARRCDWFPAEVKKSLRVTYYHNAARNYPFLHELQQVLRRFGTEDVPVVVLKGAALANTVYDDPSLRPMTDLDLLVHRESVQPALRILGELGFRRVGFEVRPDADLVYESQVQLAKTGRVRFLVEIHWSLFDSPYYQQNLTMDWFWDTALTVQTGDTPMQVLGPVAQLLHLCGHAVLHHGSAGTSLLWLQDVAEVVFHYREQIDWDELLNRAQEFRLILSVQQVLGQVAAEWGVPIPARALSRLAALHPSPAEQQVTAWRTAKQRPVAQRFWSDLASMDGWRRRLHYAWIQFLPSMTYMQSRYNIRHRLLVPLYYPYRWWVGLRGVLRNRFDADPPEAMPPAQNGHPQ